MELADFIKSYDRTFWPIERLKILLENEGFTGVLECVTDIENHLKMVEVKYLDKMEYLVTGEE